MTQSTDPRADRALAQIDGLTAALGFFLAFLLALSVLFVAFGSGELFGFGGDEVCADARPGAIPFGGGSARRAVPGLAPEARWHVEAIEVCDTAPGLGVRVGASLRPLAETGLLVGALLLVRRVISRARSHGLFAPGVATLVQTLGRFLVVGAPVSALLAQVSDGIVIDAAVRGVAWHDDLLSWDFPWAVLITGVGLVSTAKVMAYARLLQDDVDGTV